MQEILMGDLSASFDHHGNLCCHGEHLAPIYFKMLGQLKEVRASHSFPEWCIEVEYKGDVTPANSALRVLKRELESVGEEDLAEIADQGLNGTRLIIFGRSHAGQSRRSHNPIKQGDNPTPA